jgi:hypothetical protein
MPPVSGVRLRVNTVPHAINSRQYDGLPAFGESEARRTIRTHAALAIFSGPYNSRN